MLFLCALTLNGYFSAYPLNASSSPAERERTEQAILQSAAILSAKEVDLRQRSLALATYRSAVLKLLPILKNDSVASQRKRQKGFFNPPDLSEITPVGRSRVTVSGLHRDGLGLPVIGRIAQSGVTDPNAPGSGFVVPATALVLPDSGRRMELLLIDPTSVETIEAFGKELPVAMDLEAWLNAVEATGPPVGAGVRYMLRSDEFAHQARLIFLQPFDPDRTPVVLIHGLMSTPRMWKPVLDGLLADREIRKNYQFWFFYYPTGQPVPFSALQLRQGLTEAALRYPLRRPLVLIGHSMGGILARAQVSRISAADAEQVVPEVGRLPTSSLARNAVIFEPRTDVERIIFIATPHKGSTVAMGNLAALGMRLIDLPDWIVSELQSPSVDSRQLPTSIHGLSPDSQFLQALDRFPSGLPVHSIIGDRGRANESSSSDGIVSYSSSHLDFANSELMIPTGHGGFAHPKAIAEIARILKLNRLEKQPRLSK
jgi:pimeloyl-ACP methyl ester carboxylesterase